MDRESPNRLRWDRFAEDEVARDAVLEAIATTRAIRRFRFEQIPESDLARMMFAASRAPTGSNRQPHRFVVLRDGDAARQAKAVLGTAFREGWKAKRGSDGYDKGSGQHVDSAKARMAATMQAFVDNFEQIPVVVLACLERYRDPVVTEGGSVFPAVQNLLLAARVLGYGGVITMWHGSVEEQLRQIVGIPAQSAIHAVIPLGRPIGGHGPVRRRPIAELVYEDVWGQRAEWTVEPQDARHAQAGPPAPS